MQVLSNNLNDVIEFEIAKKCNFKSTFVSKYSLFYKAGSHKSKINGVEYNLKNFFANKCFFVKLICTIFVIV